jgi:tetratricopeptide (TPR) repeat protein
MNKKYIYFFLFLSSCGRVSDQLEGVRSSVQAYRSLMDKDLERFHHHVVEQIGFEPENPLAHSNLGLSFFLRKEFEKSVGAFRDVLRIGKDDLSFYYAHFGLGANFGEQKNIDEALAEYQLALELQPQSLEVKTNIELLIQQQSQKSQNQKQDQDQKQKKDDQDKNKNSSQQQQNSSGGDQGEKKDQQSGDQNKSQNNDQKKNDQNDQKKDDSRNYQGGSEEKNQQTNDFRSKELSKKEAEQILDSLSDQEQRVRQQYFRKERKEAPRGKDW